jgi:hypothetical protein
MSNHFLYYSKCNEKVSESAIAHCWRSIEQSRTTAYNVPWERTESDSEDDNNFDFDDDHLVQNNEESAVLPDVPLTPLNVGIHMLLNGNFGNIQVIKRQKGITHTSSEYAETKLLKILEDANCPNYLFGDILDWAADARRRGYNFELTCNLEKRFNLKFCRPEQVTVAFPQDNLFVDITRFNFLAQFHSLITDKSLNGDITQLDVPQDDPFGKYESPDGRLGAFNSGSWYQKAWANQCEPDSDDWMCPIIYGCDETHVGSSQGRASVTPLIFTLSYQITSLGHNGDNLDRYLMGRQFMVIFINFTINLCGAPLSGADVLGLPSWVQSIFLGSGIAMILTVVTVGQLTAQVNASHCMIDYINTHFVTFTLYVTLIIEKTGIMHCYYLIRDMFNWATGKPVETNEPPRSAVHNFFHWGRMLFSLGVLAFALAVTLEGLFQGQTTMWEGVPNGVAVILFFLLMSVVGILEGMQIAFFAVSNLPAGERGTHPMAMKTCKLLFRGEGRNLLGFMVGRQMTVTLCFFVIVCVTTLAAEISVDDHIFGVSDPIQKFFNMGFLGAIITTILASISW